MMWYSSNVQFLIEQINTEWLKTITNVLENFWQARPVKMF